MIGYRLCNRLIGHRWRKLEPGVRRCVVCRCHEFGSDAADDAFSRHLLGRRK